MENFNLPNQPEQRNILPETLATSMANTLKGLADPTRLRLLSVLFCGETCVNDLAEKLGMTQSAISHQLRVLRDLKFVSYRREGQQVIYGIDDEHIGDLFQRALEHAEH
ncbi:MAG: metalloregulator ArsR/SmtB family transcription factor [Anaerolineaceae bacterium]|nr:metalloregulator ArsR/SmtB family transcription factor [Anaerolineaceae bacterium]